VKKKFFFHPLESRMICHCFPLCNEPFTFDNQTQTL